VNKINRHDVNNADTGFPTGRSPLEEGTNVRPTLSQSISNIIWGGGRSAPAAAAAAAWGCWLVAWIPEHRTARGWKV
jgi:hypothetical protein